MKLQLVYTFSEIGQERRTGYAYYGDWATTRLLTDEYPRWREKHKFPKE